MAKRIIFKDRTLADQCKHLKRKCSDTYFLTSNRSYQRAMQIMSKKLSSKLLTKEGLEYFLLNEVDCWIDLDSHPEMISFCKDVAWRIVDRLQRIK